MKKIIKQNWFKILVVILFCIIIILLSFGSNKKGDIEVKQSFLGSDLSEAQEITCSYSQTLNANYSNGKITHSLPSPETNPIISTFTELDNPTESKLNSIDSTQTITTYPLVKLYDNAEKYVFLDGNDSYLTVHTIYKKKGISTYVKNTDFFGITQIVTSAIGTCIGY